MRTLILALLAALTPLLALAQTGTVMPVPKAAYYDANGDPCNGCKLYAFETGTNTPLATYADVNLSSANAHPIVLDSAGRATVFLSNNTYRFRLDTSADVVIWTIDGVAAVPAASGNIDVAATAGEAISSGDSVYLSDGSGGGTAGRWYRADADNTYSSSSAPMVGLATAAISSGSSGTVRIAGRVTGLSGLTAGSSYYVSATVGAMTSTAPTNSRFLGAADSTTTLVMQAAPVRAAPSMLDSNQSHLLTLRTTSDLTADRNLTLVPGDAARTLTISGDATVNQDTATTGAPSFNWAGPCNGRLTATTAVPVTVSDVSAAASLYWTPYLGNECYVYDGSATWTRLTFSEITISISSCTASTPYDVFVYSNSGTLAAETLIWTNATTRATALTTVGGTYVKSGQTTRRYVGSFYCNASGGQTDDTYAKRYVYNGLHRVERAMRVLEDQNSWNDGGVSLAMRQANGDATNQLDIMVGLQEDALSAQVLVHVTQSAANEVVVAAIGFDSTSAAATGSLIANWNSVTGIRFPLSPSYVTVPAVGRHTITWLEQSAIGGGGTTTWFGDNNQPTVTQSGIFGMWRN